MGPSDAGWRLEQCPQAAHKSQVCHNSGGAAARRSAGGLPFFVWPDLAAPVGWTEAVCIWGVAESWGSAGPTNMLACAGASYSRNACHLVPWLVLEALTVEHFFCVAVGCHVAFDLCYRRQMRLVPTHTSRPRDLQEQGLCTLLQSLHSSGQAAHKSQLLPPELGGARVKRRQCRRSRGSSRGRASQNSKQVRGHRGSWLSSWEGPAEAGERVSWKSAEQLKGLRGSVASGSVLPSLLSLQQQDLRWSAA